MNKRILTITLTLIFFLCAAPVLANETDFSSNRLLEALAAGDVQLAYAGLGGIFVDMGDGQTQKFLHAGKKLYIDPDVETAEGYVWVWFYHSALVPANNTTNNSLDAAPIMQGGAVRASDMTSVPPQISGAGRYSNLPRESSGSNNVDTPPPGHTP